MVVRWQYTVLAIAILLSTFTTASKQDDDTDKSEIAEVISSYYSEFNLTDIYKPVTLGARLFDSAVDTYTNQPNTEPGTCPTELKLKVREKNGTLIVKLPSGLNAVDEDCPPAPGFENSKIELLDYSKQPPGHPEIPLLNDGEFYVAGFAHTLFQCPGDKATPFTGLQLTSLKTLIAPRLRSTLRQLAVPDFVITGVLGVKVDNDGDVPLDSGVHQRWNITYIKRVVRGARDEFEKLDDYYVLVLNREASRRERVPVNVVDPVIAKVENGSVDDDVSPFDVVRQLRLDHPRCAYVQHGAPAAAEIQKKIETLVSSVLPLFGHSRWSNMPVPSLTLYPTSSRCVENGSRSITSLSLSKPPSDLAALLSERDLPNWFTVSVNGAVCSSARMESVLEMDYHPHKSRLSLPALSLSAELVAFLEEQRGKTRGATRSPLRTEYPDLAARLLDILAKASIFAARIELKSCYQLDNRRTVDLLILRRSASFLYCNGFPRIGGGGSPRYCGGVGGEKRYAAFLVQKRAASDCVYSSSEFEASVLRGDIALVPSIEPESTDGPFVIGQNATDVSPTLSPIV